MNPPLAAVQFALSVPQPDGSTVSHTLPAGQTLFVLGANGTGKSSLMLHFYRANGQTAKRISAHRQTWFASNAMNLTAAQRRDTGSNIQNQDMGYESRWKEDYSAQRASIAIYDLIDAENARARAIASEVTANHLNAAVKLAKKDPPLATINELLRLSNLPLVISVEANEEVLASRAGSKPYSVAELSDGERNALLIAATVLTAPQNTLLLIDEPERHLHRSIISPLLTLLFSKRQDCAFVVSTHEVMLSVDNPRASTLLVRDCIYKDTAVSAWSANLIAPDTNIDEALKQDILGARSRILFVEGTESSLDKPLYSLIFPNTSIIPKTSFRDVEHAVDGLRSAANLHWVSAYGIVDNDQRTQADIDRLRAKHVYPLSVFSIESIYYAPEIQRRVAKRHASSVGTDSVATVENARAAALAAVAPHTERLSIIAVEKSVREKVQACLPTRKTLQQSAPISVQIDVATIIDKEKEKLENALREGDLAELLARYPLRETPALDQIASKLGFRDRAQYESAVRKLLLEDTGALAYVRSQLAPLAQQLAT